MKTITNTLFYLLISFASLSASAEFYYYDARDLDFPIGFPVTTDKGFDYGVRNYATEALKNKTGALSFFPGDILLMHGPNGTEGLRYWINPPDVWRTTTYQNEWVQEEAKTIFILRQAGQTIGGDPIITGGGGTNDDITCLLPVPDCNQEQEPLLIDLGQDGFHLGAPNTGILYDFFGDGELRPTQWVAPNGNEAFLALDRNGNGTIDNGTELFGRGLFDNSQQRANHGFEQLRQYDFSFNGGNHDDIIDAQDAIWPELLLWNDFNADGLSTPDELMPLSASAITALQTKPKESARFDPSGNALRLWAWATASGIQGNKQFKMVDVFFAPWQYSNN